MSFASIIVATSRVLLVGLIGTDWEHQGVRIIESYCKPFVYILVCI